MKKVLFLAFMGLFFSCGNTSEKNKNIENKKAIEFYEKARNLYAEFTTERDTILKAMALLDSAILLNPQYISAYVSKQSYQMRLGEYENALSTVKIVEKLDPDNADLKTMAGIYYMINNDNNSAEIKLLQADSLWNIALDTISSNNDMALLHVLMNKGTILKFLGKETEANNLFNRILNDTIFDKEQYHEIKKILILCLLLQLKRIYMSNFCKD